MLKLSIWAVLEVSAAFLGKWTPYYCDDGTLLIERSGAINWSCRIDGCSPSDQVCWQERTNCDETQCATTPCGGQLDCLTLWATCAGTYICYDPEGVGCGYGECDE